MNSFNWETSQKCQTRIILNGHEFQKKRDKDKTQDLQKIEITYFPENNNHIIIIIVSTAPA